MAPHCISPWKPFAGRVLRLCMWIPLHIDWDLLRSRLLSSSSKINRCTPGKSRVASESVLTLDWTSLFSSSE